MTTYTGASLADGQVASSVGTIYTCPSSTEAFIKKITLGNTGSATQTVSLYLLRSGSTKRLLRQYQLAQFETGDFENIVLSAADAIQAISTNASAVDYTVYGTTAA